VNGFVGNALDPTAFTFVIQPRSGVDPAKTEASLSDELEKLQSNEVPADELRKAKNQLLAQHYRSMKTIEGRANLLGTYEIFYGGYDKLFHADQEIEAVSAADVQRVARRYFGAKNRTVATLVPEKPEVKR
jgi:zinc protease